VIQIVDSPENIQRLLPVVEEMMDKRLIAISDVSAVRVQKAAAARDAGPDSG
jgi:PII-like signaling protein